MRKQSQHAGLPFSTLAVAATLAAACAALLGGCTTMPWDSTPFYSSSPTSTVPAIVVPAGYYRANPGDTVASIARAFGQRPQDIASWNGLAPNASVIQGQVLRVAPSGASPNPGVGLPPAGSNGAPGTPGSPGAAAQQGVLVWPLRGPVLKTFASGGSKGIVIGGRPGDQVRAAATGRVVYAGSGIEAYGPLIIIKHDDSLITAYGQNSKLLVNEGDAVTQGQPIAEVGVDNRGVGSIQFEVRKDGHPVDPLGWLPK